MIFMSKNNKIHKKETGNQNNEYAGIPKVLSKDMIVALIGTKISVPEDKIARLLTDLEKVLIDCHKQGKTVELGSLSLEFRMKDRSD